MGQSRLTALLTRLALDRPTSRAWAMYDWANSAFMTTIIAAVFPIYYARVAASGLDSDVAQERYQLTTAIALVVIAALAPVLGALADFRAIKKRMLTVFALLGIVATAGMFFIESGDWALALVLFAAANVGAAGSIVFYDSLLPHVARPEEMDRLSTAGFGLGYVGGGLLLAVNLAWIMNPQWFGLPSGSSETLPTRLAFLSVAVWWFVFTIPLWRKISEPPRLLELDETTTQSPIATSLSRLRETWKDLRRYKHALLMLVAFLLFNDGIVTIIRMAVIYATTKEFDDGVLIGTILMVQFLGIPFAFLFGQLAPRFGTKRMILIGLSVYCGIGVFAFFMTSNVHFIALGVLVATVQGGTQGLSRSLFASLIPKHKSGEFFAFFAVGEKFAGIFGPLIFWLVTVLSGSAQNAVLSVIPFFLIGAILLWRVDVAEGRRVAQAADAQVRAV